MGNDAPADSKKTPAAPLDSTTTTPPTKPEESLFDNIMRPTPTAPAADAKPPAADTKPPAADAKPPAPQLKDNVEDNPLFGPAKPPDAKPPAADVKPPAADVKPPAADVKPPAADVKPPAADVKPPAADVKPPAADVKPPAADVKPPAADVKPPAADVKPPAADVKPPAADVKPPAADVKPPAADVKPPAADVKPPAADVKPPADRAVVTDALAGVVEPAFKATVNEKIAKLVQNINNGADLLKEGKIDETVNAYRAAADLVSPAEQKLFLQEQKRVGELIKAEKLKPADQQDAKKLEEMKQLERNLRTLGLVKIFTEVNAGLIYTQTSDLKKAGAAFEKAFVNEKEMFDQKLIPELYLKNDPNLGSRITAISEKTGVDVRELMGKSAAHAGIDPKLVGFDTGRGPPAGVDQPPATVKPPAGADQPPAGTVKPPAGADQPPAGTVKKPAVETVKPPAGADQPPAGTVKKPAVETVKPPAGADQPPAGTVKKTAVETVKPPAGTDQPPAGTVKPPAGADQLPAGTVKPAAGDQKVAVVKSSDKPPTGGDKPPVAVPGDKAIEAAVVFSPTDKAGRTPVERVGFWLDQANEKQQLTPEIRKEIEAAIVDADKGISPKLQVLERQDADLKVKRAAFLDGKVPGGTIKLVDAITAVDATILGTFVEKNENGKLIIQQTKEGLIDKLMPPADYKMSDEIKKAMPPADYKPSTPKAADSKLSDADYRIESFRNDLRIRDYRSGVKGLYASLDESMNDAAYKETLAKLKAVLPADSKAMVDALTERDRITKDVRPVQFDLNTTDARIPTEKNQSAMARAMYADLLRTANDDVAAKKYFTEAYATNQLPGATEEFRTMAIQADVSPIELVNAAVKQNQDRGGAKHGKALEVENLLQEANLTYAAAPADKKAEVATKLTPAIEKLQKMADLEAAQVDARSKALMADYQKTLPADDKQKVELKALERKMIDAEGKFTPAETQLVETYMDTSLAQGVRDKAKEDLKLTQKDWVNDTDRFKEILGDKGKDYIEVKAKIAFHLMDVSKTTENSFYSRAIQANMMFQTGNKEGAKAKLAEGFGAIPAVMRGKLLDSRPKVAELATTIGVDLNAMKALPEPKIAAVPAAKPPEATPPDAKLPEVKPPEAKPPEVKPPGDKPPGATTVDKPADPVPAGRVNPVAGADPRFLKMTDADLDKRIADKSGKLEHVEEVKDLYKELVRRYDSDLTKEQFDVAVPAMKLLTDALKAGKQLTGDEDHRVVSTDPKDDLSPNLRWKFHRAVVGDMESMNNQIRIRQEYAQFLKASNQFADAEKMGIEARDYAERLMKPLDIGGKQVRVIDLMQQEAGRLVDDQSMISDPQKRQAMDKASWLLKGSNLDSGAIKTPINTNKFLAQLYLGTEVIPKLNADGAITGIQEIQFGKSSAFKPEKALEASQKALQYTRDILKLDPLDAKTAKENPGVASLFGVLADVVDKPEKYKLYVGKKGETFVNDKGETVYLKGGELVGKNDHDVPILIEAHSVQNLKNQIRKDSTIDSLLTDAVVTVGVVSAVALMRNPKVAEFFEKGMGKYGSYAGAATKVAGYTAIGTAGLLGRHYGYEYLTGVKESWTDSSVHVVGSVAAAEIGGRLSGRGSLLTGATGGAPQFAKFDTEASAGFLKKQGYETTGQLMDLLKSQGFLNEAKQFVSLPRGTKLFAEAGGLEPQVAEALSKANLKGARMGTVAEAIMADSKLSSGVKQADLAARVAQADAGGLKTVGDLQRMVEADQKGLQELAQHTESLGDKVKIADALAGNPQAEQLMGLANKYGLKNVGAVKALAATTEKIGFDKVFPKLAEMRSANIINAETKIADAVNMGTHALEGPGLQRMLSLVPAGERAGLLTEAALKEVMAASPISGNRSIISRLKDGAGSVKNGTVATWNTVTTKEGWGTMRTAVGDVLAPLGSKNFYTKTIPSAAWSGGEFGLTKLNQARKVVTDRFEFRGLDPTKATPEALSRARFASGFYGALGAAGTYNTVVKPYDMTGQVFGVTLPQLGSDGQPHPIFQNPDGEDYTWMQALKESHFPSVTGVDQTKMPNYAKTFIVPAAEALMGTPGQALFGSIFLKPGAIYKPVWSNPETGTFRKSMQSFFPLSPTRWNNWNAGVFSGPTMATGGLFAGALTTSGVDSIGQRLKVGNTKRILDMANKPITNAPLPKQRTDLDDVQLPPKPDTPAVVPPVVPPKAGDKDKPKDNKLVEPPPPGSG